MLANYKIIKITTVDTLKDVIFHLADKNEYFLYRGQSNYKWTLQPSLERVINKLNIKDIDLINYENKIVQECKKNGDVVLPIEIISKIQHYGGATRLIDFTHEFPIALFFAFCEFPSQPISIWAISRRDIPYISNNEIKAYEGKLDLFEIDLQRNFQEEKLWNLYIDDFVLSKFTNIDDFIEYKMRDYPEELKSFKIGALDLLANKEDEYGWQYQREHGVETTTINPHELSPRERFIQESLKKYCSKTSNERQYRQRGLFLFAPNNQHSFEKNLFLGKSWNEMESEIPVVENPGLNRLNKIFSDVYHSFRGVIKFDIDHSLIDSILKILKKGNYEILLPDFWNGGQERVDKNVENVLWDGASISFKYLFPDESGFFRNLTHKILED